MAYVKCKQMYHFWTTWVSYPNIISLAHYDSFIMNSQKTFFCISAIKENIQSKNQVLNARDKKSDNVPIRDMLCSQPIKCKCYNIYSLTGPKFYNFTRQQNNKDAQIITKTSRSRLCEIMLISKVMNIIGTLIVYCGFITQYEC